jgi:hypothetical protein
LTRLNWSRSFASVDFHVFDWHCGKSVGEGLVTPKKVGSGFEMESAGMCCQLTFRDFPFCLWPFPGISLMCRRQTKFKTFPFLAILLNIVALSPHIKTYRLYHRTSEAASMARWRTVVPTGRLAQVVGGLGSVVCKVCNCLCFSRRRMLARYLVERLCLRGARGRNSGLTVQKSR